MEGFQAISTDILHQVNQNIPRCKCNISVPSLNLLCSHMTCTTNTGFGYLQLWQFQTYLRHKLCKLQIRSQPYMSLMYGREYWKTCEEMSGTDGHVT